MFFRRVQKIICVNALTPTGDLPILPAQLSQELKRKLKVSAMNTLLPAEPLIPAQLINESLKLSKSCLPGGFFFAILRSKIKWHDK